MPQMMTPQQIAENEKQFLDSQFAPLDITAFPSLQQMPTDSFESEDKNGFNRLDTGGGNSLKESLTQLAADPTVLSQIAAENPAAAEALSEAQDLASEAESRRFMANNPDYERGDGNLEGLTLVLGHNLLGWSESEVETRDPEEAREELIQRGYWTAENLELAFDALRRHGLADLRPGQVKELSADEKLEVIRKAQAGVNLHDDSKLWEALADYCSYATGLDPDDIDFAAPEYRQVIDQGVFFLWEMTEPSYSPTPERRAWMLSYFAGRPLSFPLVAQAFKALEQAEARGYTNGLLAPKEESVSLDDLDDSQIENLYRGTRRYIAQQPAGILQ